MGDLADAIGRNFERLLRWVYPGGLLLVLLWAYSTSFGQNQSKLFNDLKDLAGSWWVILIGALFAGFAIYIIQNKMVSLLLHWLFSHKKIKSIFVCNSAVNLIKMRAHLNPVWFQGYPDYGWAMYHATSVTGLLILVFSIIQVTTCEFIIASIIGIFLSLLLLLSSLTHWAILQELFSESNKCNVDFLKEIGELADKRIYPHLSNKSSQ